MFFDKDLRYCQALYGSYYCLCINLSSMSIFLTCTSTCTDDDNGIGDSVESNLDHIKHHPRLWVCLQELLSSPDYSTRLRSLFSTEAYFSMLCAAQCLGRGLTICVSLSQLALHLGTQTDSEIYPFSDLFQDYQVDIVTLRLVWLGWWTLWPATRTGPGSPPTGSGTSARSLWRTAGCENTISLLMRLWDKGRT